MLSVEKLYFKYNYNKTLGEWESFQSLIYINRMLIENGRTIFV